MSDPLSKEPKFVPRPCAVCGEPNTVEHRCDYPPSKPKVRRYSGNAEGMVRIDQFGGEGGFVASEDYDAALAEIERLTRERDEALERIGILQLVGSRIAAERDRLRALIEDAVCPTLGERCITREALRPTDETTVPQAIGGGPFGCEHNWNGSGPCPICHR